MSRIVTLVVLSGMDTRHETTNNGAAAQGGTMRNASGTIDTASIHYLMNNVHVVACVARLHVDASASEVITHVAPQLASLETTRPRDIFYFFAACVARHYSNRAAYSVATRRAV